MDSSASSLGETKQKILELLLDGSKSAGEVAERLKIQKSAARVHLESLQSSQAVRSKFKIEKMGRPKKVYELSESGRELFPREYDLFLNLVLGKIAGKKGDAEVKEIIDSVAEDIAAGIRAKIKDRHSTGLEQSLRIVNDASNDMGFVSTLKKEGDSISIQSKNCILHKVATRNQDMICHGLHDKIISKSLGPDLEAKVELKECMALGDTFCRHLVSRRKNVD